MRVIDDYEFVWMLRGRARFVESDHTTVLTPGKLLLVPPGVRHGFEWDPQGPTVHGFVHFDAECLGEPVDRPRLIDMSGSAPIAGLCSYLLTLSNDDDIDRTLRYLAWVALAAPPEQPVEGQLLSAVTYLRDQWRNPPLHRVSVQALASAASISRGYLNRLFQAEFGLNVAAALERSRCARAESLLTRTDLTVEAVARHCGFADVSHFSHRFTTIYGVPPSAFAGSPSVLDHHGVRRLVRLLWT